MVKQRINISHPPDIREKRECLSHARWVNNHPKNMEKEALKDFQRDRAATRLYSPPLGGMQLCVQVWG